MPQGTEPERVEHGLLAGRVPYIRGGSGEREAVVFFGGSALFRRLDRTGNPARHLRQVSRLLPGHRVTILGYAGSTFEEIVADMAVAVPRAPEVVMGISFGGMVAMRFAAEHPDLVKRLVLLVSAHRFSAPGWERMQRQFRALERGDFQEVLLDNAVLFRRSRYNLGVRWKLWREGERVGAAFRDPQAILSDCRNLFAPDCKGSAAFGRRVACPALVVGGTADQYFDPEAFTETAALIPAAGVRLFARETHMLPVENPAVVAGAIGEFLGRTG